MSSMLRPLSMEARPRWAWRLRYSQSGVLYHCFAEVGKEGVYFSLGEHLSPLLGDIAVVIINVGPMETR